LQGHRLFLFRKVGTYAEIVKALNEKAVVTARYISEMVIESFGVEYPVSAKEYPVSERDDNFIRLTLYYDTDRSVYLLPRTKANAKIFDKLMKKAIEDLDENITGIIYNYRYKMRESLRTLCREFSADINKMSSELTSLLTYIEHCHLAESQKLCETRSHYMEIIYQLDHIGLTCI